VRRNGRIAGRVCAAAALAVVMVCGIPALATAASADAAVASAAARSAPAALADAAIARAATRTAAPASPQAPDSTASCVGLITAVYSYITKATATVFCSLPSQIPNHWGIVIGTAGCVAGFVALGVNRYDAIFACNAANPHVPLTQEEWCENTVGTGCLNAWSGGPWVKDYTGGPETGDDHQVFYLVDVDNSVGNATGNYQIVYDGQGTSWADQCVGDAYNNSGDADTSLDSCGNDTGGGSGWGTEMSVGTNGCPSGEAWIHDNHWNGYLGPPAGAVNGSHFYLNKPTPYCFNVAFES
jgi:hypothetical protein